MTRRLLRAALLAAAAAVPLAGCQTLFHRPKPTPAPPPPQVIMPTPEPSLTLPKPTPPPQPSPARNCVPKALGPPPRYPDTDAALRAAPGAADRYQLMAAGRILRQERLDELERAIAGCR